MPQPPPPAVDLFSLSGRVAVVTGAAGQLGGVFTRALLGAGASVAALDLRPGNPRGALQEIVSDRLLLVKADITRRDRLRRALAFVTRRFGSPDLLVNNAALDTPPGSSGAATGPGETFPEKTWRALLDTNLTGTFLCCQTFGAAMARRGRGNIINISSVYGRRSPDQRIYAYRRPPFFKPLAYSVSKAGVEMMTRWLATTWAGRGVRVNNLVLAGVLRRQDPCFLRHYRRKIPLGRMARAEELPGALLFLASDASSFMTGADLVLDGGYTCW